MEPSAKLKVSFKLFVLNVIGALLAGVGLVDVLGQGAVLHPGFTAAWLGWAMMLVGFGLMAWFMVDIFKRVRVQQRARQAETR